MRKQKHITNETRQYVRRLITEYFYDKERKNFKIKVSGTVMQIVLHWSYIRYSRLTQTSEITIPHWKSELYNWLFSICETEISKKDNPKARLIAIQEEWKESGYLDDATRIVKMLAITFKRKGFTITKHQAEQIATEFIDNLPTMINIMANADVFELDSYIESL